MGIFEWIKVGIGYILGWIYDFVPNYGVALILFTFAIKVLLLPLGLKQQKAMTKMQVMQPKIEALKEKYGDDKQKLQQETAKLYKEYNVGCAGGCLPMLIQLPILIMLYRVIQQPLEYMLHMSGDQINALKTQFEIKDQILLAKAAGEINFNFFGLDLSGTPSAHGWFSLPMLIPVFAALTTYFSSKVTELMNKKKNGKKEEAEEKPKRILSPEQKDSSKPAGAEVGKSMTIIMPFMTLFITANFYSAIGIYWIASNIFSVGQTVLLNGFYAKRLKLEIEKRETELAEKRQLRYGNKKRKGNK